MAEAAEKPADTEPSPGAHWGYLFQPDNRPTDKLDRLLQGIAACISTEMHSYGSPDLNPAQLASFYRRVGGQYDPLFLDMPPQSIAYIYQSLGCLHSLQPDPAAEDGPYAAPSIPALKPTGFVTWQTIQLLLGPEEHVPFIQNALRAFDVIDPKDGEPFPKELPRDAFPSRPDPKMVQWHEGVSSRLRAEAQKEVEMSTTLDVHKHNHDSRPHSGNTPTTGGSLALKHDSEERAAAASYFSNPFNKNREGRPGVVRTFTNAPRRVMQGGRAVAATTGRTIKNIVDPHLWSGDSGGHGDRDRSSREREHERRRRSVPAEDSDLGNMSPPHERDLSRRHNVAHPHPRSRSPGRVPLRNPRDDRRPNPQSRAYSAKPSPRDASRDGKLPRRRPSGSPGSSSDTSPGRNSRRRDPTSPRAPRPHARRHRSQDAPASPRDYFEDWQRPRPHHYQAGPGVSWQPVPAGNPAHRPNSHRIPMRGGPEIRRNDASYHDDDDETDSTDAELTEYRRPQQSPHLAAKPHLFPSTSPPMAAKVGHVRGVSGSSAHSPENYLARPSPSEYRPIDERDKTVRFAPSNTFPLSHAKSTSPHGRPHFGQESSPVSPERPIEAPGYPVRRGSAPSMSPGSTDPAAQDDRFDYRDAARPRAATGAPPLLYGEVQPGSSGSGSGGNGHASSSRSPGRGPRKVTSVEGVKGRRYAHEMSWPGGRRMNE
ncbi:hypothetical protein FH972_022700 [Carpinus fangiana]|uniref:DUF7514 domain-containing protein n=1 Tax=Carpinus fangiana TaxID=176857 RepID=A0A5N6KT04_9ROSI|nr:hypothetical protein FH972_022700 [Carpinus fangiana]